MSTLAISIPVPASGEGAAVDVSSLVRAKTVILTGTFRGIYVLLASHDDLHFVPILQFDAGGVEGAKQTLPGAWKSARLRAGTPTTAPVGTVTCEISGVSVPGQNYFAQVAALPAGFSGSTATVDLAPLMPPTGPEEDIVLICKGDLQGLLVVEGSQDGTRFVPIGDFRIDRRPEGAPAVLELPPLLTLDKVRYVRASLNGEVGAGGAVVTIGGSVPTSGGGETLSETYDEGSIISDQTMTLLDSKGGPIVIDGSDPGFTGSYFFRIVAPAGVQFDVPSGTDGISLGPNENIVIGTTSAPASADPAGRNIVIGRSAAASGGSYLTLVMGELSRVDNSPGGMAISPFIANILSGSNDAIAMGVLVTVDTNSPLAMAYGRVAYVGPDSPTSIVFGNNSRVGQVAGAGSPNNLLFGNDNVIEVGCTANFAAGLSLQINTGCTDVVNMGRNSTVDHDSHIVVVIGRDHTIADGVVRGVAIGDGIDVQAGVEYHVAIGYAISVGAGASGCVTIGRGSGVGAGAVGCFCGGTGSGVSAGVVDAVALGTSAGSGFSYGVAVGVLSYVSGLSGVAVGPQSSSAEYAVALGYFATAAAHQCVVGDNLHGAPPDGAIHLFAVRGYNGAVLDTIAAVDDPASGETGLTVVHNNGATTANKLIKAAAVPGVGSLLLYIDP